MDTQNNNEQKNNNNNIYVNTPDNSILTVEGQKKLMAYRMKYMLPFLLIPFIFIGFTMYNTYSVTQRALEKEQIQRDIAENLKKQAVPINSPAEKCRSITLNQYGTTNSPDAQKLMAQCMSAEAEYQKNTAR